MSHSQNHKNIMLRFEEIYNNLYGAKSWFESALPLKFTALAALACHGSGHQLSNQIQATAQKLKEETPWFKQMDKSQRYIMSTMLILHKDRASNFMVEVDRVRKMFRKEKISRGYGHELMAILILRAGNNLAPISGDKVNRFKQILTHMKAYHPWITGSDDYPLCAVLTGCKGSPQTMVDGIENIYQKMRNQGFSAGNPLQNVANSLYLADQAPEKLVNKFTELHQAFKQRKVTIFNSDYHAIAMLCFLNGSPSELADAVQAKRTQLRELKAKPDANLSFNIACSLTFMERRGSQGDLSLATVKALMDMQAIIEAQQAAC